MRGAKTQPDQGYHEAKCGPDAPKNISNDNFDCSQTFLFLTFVGSITKPL